MNLTLKQGAIAACLLDAMTDKEIVRATGMGLRSVEEINARLRRKFQARNRVALALALQKHLEDGEAE